MAALSLLRGHTKTVCGSAWFVSNARLLVGNVRAVSSRAAVRGSGLTRSDLHDAADLDEEALSSMRAGGSTADLYAADFTDSEQAFAIERLAPAATAYHKHARGVAAQHDELLPVDALGEGDEDTSPYDEEFGENRSLGMMLNPRSRCGKERNIDSQAGVLQRLAALERQEADGRTNGRSKGRQSFASTRFQENTPIRIRVLDVDALSLEELHRGFMHTLVRRRPAEVSIHVASRLAQFRDSFKQQSYESLLRDCGKLFGPVHGPELLALFARCHSTISVPYMVDYTRRFGQFSRAFIAGQVERSLRPAFFDFLRYQKKGGVRPLPLVVAQPWALSSYTRLMGKSTIKSYLHEQLKINGCVPKGELESDTDPNLSVEARAAERLSAAGSLQLDAPIRKQRSSRDDLVPRPALLDAIMKQEFAGESWDSDVAESGETSEYGELMAPHKSHDSHADSPKIEEDTEPSSLKGGFGMQFEHVVPETVLEAAGPSDALVDPSEERFFRQRNQTAEDTADGFDDRWWQTKHRTFFRHMNRAYRVTEGAQWKMVADPRGPVYAPRRKHKSRSENRDNRLRSRVMQGVSRA